MKRAFVSDLYVTNTGASEAMLTLTILGKTVSARVERELVDLKQDTGGK